MNDPDTLALVTDEPTSWHSRELRRAFAQLGFSVRSLDLRKCRFDLTAGIQGLVLPGFSRALPRAVFVRGVPAGSLEQVVLRLDFLHALRELGVPVYNDARAIERSVDKAMTSFLLHQHGVPTPATWTTEDCAAARRIVMRSLAADRSLVAKPLFGSQGYGVRQVQSVPPIGAPAAAAGPEPSLMDSGVAYLQRWVPPSDTSFADWRVLVAGNQAIGVMRRCSKHWVTNIAQGARATPVPEDAPEHPQLCALAVRAARALQMDYAGVDLMREPTGDFTVIEVNGVPAWRGLQRVVSFNIAERLARDLIERRLGIALPLKQRAGHAA
jgi:RimK family alpha-L-glutamate ligase